MTEDELQAGLERTTPERERYELFVEEAQDLVNKFDHAATVP